MKTRMHPKMMKPPPKPCVPRKDQPDQLPMMPPPAPLPSSAARVVGPAMPPPAHVESQTSTRSAASQKSDNDMQKAGKTKHHIGPARPSSAVGTLAALQQAVTAPSQASKDKSNPIKMEVVGRRFMTSLKDGTNNIALIFTLTQKTSKYNDHH